MTYEEFRKICERFIFKNCEYCKLFKICDMIENKNIVAASREHYQLFLEKEKIFIRKQKLKKLLK